ncbi:MAG: hypothetical protein QXD43_01405 [Candidatus Aenigmatarchaeota archaeon]
MKKISEMSLVNCLKKETEIIECFIREKDNPLKKLNDANEITDIAKKVLQTTMELYNTKTTRKSYVITPRFL